MPRGKKGLDEWAQTQNLIRELIASGYARDSSAYKQLVQGIKRVTGTRKVMTLDPLDYPDKTIKGHNVRQEIYDLSAKFNRSLTRSMEGIEQARDDAFNRAIQMGIPEDKVDEFYKLLVKAREQIGDSEFVKHSEQIVDTLRAVFDPEMTMTTPDGVEVLLNPRPMEYTSKMKLGQREPTSYDYGVVLRGIKKLIKDDATYEEFVEFGKSFGYRLD